MFLLLIDREAYHIIVEQDSRLPASKRPVQIRQWVQKHRRYDWVPTITDIAKYGAECQTWWSTLQPSTRAKTSSGTLSRKRLSKDAWVPLMQGGPNGVFLVVMLLAWWIRAAGEGTDDLRAALEMADDLGWAFSQIIPATQDATSSGNEREGEPPKKRQRVDGRQMRQKSRGA